MGQDRATKCLTPRKCRLRKRTPAASAREAASRRPGRGRPEMRRISARTAWPLQSAAGCVQDPDRCEGEPRAYIESDRLRDNHVDEQHQNPGPEPGPRNVYPGRRLSVLAQLHHEHRHAQHDHRQTEHLGEKIRQRVVAAERGPVQKHPERDADDRRQPCCHDSPPCALRRFFACSST